MTPKDRGKQILNFDYLRQKVIHEPVNFDTAWCLFRIIYVVTGEISIWPHTNPHNEMQVNTSAKILSLV